MFIPLIIEKSMFLRFFWPVLSDASRRRLWSLHSHFLSPRKPPLKSSESQDGEKRRDSRKGGFLNLIKSRSSKSDKGQAAAAPTTVATATPAPATVTPANSAPASAGAEQPPSPKNSQLRSTAPDPAKGKETKGPATDHSSSSDRSEELKTPDSVDEPSEGDGKGSPQGSRRYGVQVMGSGLLAEMKAKQERRAAGAQKVCVHTPAVSVLAALAVTVGGGFASPRSQCLEGEPIHMGHSLAHYLLPSCLNVLTVWSHVSLLLSFSVLMLH